jgi:hypothetical protein
MAKISFVNSGGGTPGGTTTQVQFNDSGSFGGSSGLVYDKATQTLTGEKVVASSGFTGSLQGTASYAVHAASAGTSTSAASATVATSATTALTASYVLNAVSASFASTAANSSLFDGRNSSSFAGLTANTFTGVQTFTAPVTGTTAYFSGGISAGGISGSLTKLADGSSFLVAGSGVTITTGSNGAVTIAAGGGEYIPAMFFVEGSVPVFVGTSKSYAYKACTVSSLAISAQNAPTGAAINVRINKNGSSLVTGSLSAGSNFQKVSGLSASVAEGDYLTLDVTQIGSTYPGYDLTVKAIAG